MVDWDARTCLCAGILLPKQRCASICKVAIWPEPVCPVLCRLLRYMVSDCGDYDADGLLLACMREYLIWPNHALQRTLLLRFGWAMSLGIAQRPVSRVAELGR